MFVRQLEPHPHSYRRIYPIAQQLKMISSSYLIRQAFSAKCEILPDGKKCRIGAYFCTPRYQPEQSMLLNHLNVRFLFGTLETNIKINETEAPCCTPAVFAMISGW